MKNIVNAFLIVVYGLFLTFVPQLILYYVGVFAISVILARFGLFGDIVVEWVRKIRKK